MGCDRQSEAAHEILRLAVDISTDYHQRGDPNVRNGWKKCSSLLVDELNVFDGGRTAPSIVSQIQSSVGIRKRTLNDIGFNEVHIWIQIGPKSNEYQFSALLTLTKKIIILQEQGTEPVKSQNHLTDHIYCQTPGE
jgi:hypothetical protein